MCSLCGLLACYCYLDGCRRDDNEDDDDEKRTLGLLTRLSALCATASFCGTRYLPPVVLCIGRVLEGTDIADGGARMTATCTCSARTRPRSATRGSWRSRTQ
eukprot:1937967-Rhodomonas_salina.1